MRPAQKQGVNALGLQRVLGLGSYQTAWTMLHRFRTAMVRPGRERLHGKVEVDETYLASTLRELGYLHQRSVMLGSDIAAHASMPGVHRVVALLKRWILGSTMALFS